MNWEEGTTKTITVAATAGNATINKYPAINKKWRIEYLRITLVTDATVANRNLVIAIQNNALSVTYAIPLYSAAQAATQTVAYTFGGYNLATFINYSDLIIVGDNCINFYVNNGVAGDSFSGYIIVTELPA